METETKTKEEKTIYDLKLHDSMETKGGATRFTVTRVPGGWIYENYRLDAGQMTATFVRYHNEFQIKTGSNF